MSQDSETYVRSKKKACAECGIASFGTDLPDTATEDEAGEETGKSLRLTAEIPKSDPVFVLVALAF